MYELIFDMWMGNHMCVSPPVLCSTTSLRTLSMKSKTKPRSMFSVCELRTSSPVALGATGACARECWTVIKESFVTIELMQIIVT